MILKYASRGLGGAIIGSILVRRRPQIRGGRLEVDGHPATGGSLGDGLLEDDLRVAEILRGDAAEDFRSHHAHRAPADDLRGERAGPVAEEGLLLAFLDDEEIALDATL
jgi:hypothetical protein